MNCRGGAFSFHPRRSGACGRGKPANRRAAGTTGLWGRPCNRQDASLEGRGARNGQSVSAIRLPLSRSLCLYRNSCSCSHIASTPFGGPAFAMANTGYFFSLTIHKPDESAILAGSVLPLFAIDGVLPVALYLRKSPAMKSASLRLQSKGRVL